MKVKMILPALNEADKSARRSIKYSLFPPLGLATLAAYIPDEDEVSIVDEHVEVVDVTDTPDLVAIEVYTPAAYRAYALADHYHLRGAHVALGGLHVTSLPDEALQHADTVFLGPGEHTWPAFLSDFRTGRARRVYHSRVRTLVGQPRPRRDLIKRDLYLVPNSIVVSRGCPHACDFCYKNAFFAGGQSFYTRTVDETLEEIDSLHGRHLYFLDDNLFGDPRFAEALFEGMRGMDRVWQAAGTVQAVLMPGLLKRAVESGLRSLFIGFETLNPSGLQTHHKLPNLNRDYGEAIRRMHDAGVMVNASFVFGMDEDDEAIFERTVTWAIAHGIETATFHILTPYPGTALRQRMVEQGRLLTSDWSRYDTRHSVYRPTKMSPEALEAGYWQAYQMFYRWSSILRGAWTKKSLPERMRHLAYAGAWKKLDSLWDTIIRFRRVTLALPLLEAVLAGSPSPRRDHDLSTSIHQQPSCSELAVTE